MKIVNQKEFEQIEEHSMILDRVTPVTNDSTDLYQAFLTYFQPACEDIGKLIGVQDFRGGYDDMPLLYAYILHLDKTTEEGKRAIIDAHTIAFRWEAANAYCNHESNKLGWKPSIWWKWCWQQWESGAQGATEETPEV